LTITAGKLGLSQSGTQEIAGGDGGTSSVSKNGVVGFVCSAGGGKGGPLYTANPSTESQNVYSTAAQGGSVQVGIGYAGGAGGRTNVRTAPNFTNFSSDRNTCTGGGGGAGGYSGVGGSGGDGRVYYYAGTNTTISGNNGTIGNGGGGGGGGGILGVILFASSRFTSSSAGNGGGGVSLYGQTTDGTGGNGGSISITSSTSTSLVSSTGNGGSAGNATRSATYGGGASYLIDALPGAVRIVWPGSTRVFPNTDVQ
jgi:hypothetical protein